MINLNSVRSKIFLYFLMSTSVLSIIIAYIAYIVIIFFANETKDSYFEISFLVLHSIINSEINNKKSDKELIEKIKNGISLYIDNASYLTKSNKDVIHYFIFNDKKDIVEKSKKYDFLKENCKSIDSKTVDCIDRIMTDSKLIDGKSYGIAKVINKKSGLYYEIRTAHLNTRKSIYYFSFIWPESSFIKQEALLSLLFICLIYMLFIVYIFTLSRLILRTIRPLEILSKRIAHLPYHDFLSRDDTSELKAGLPIANKDEIGQLAQTFAAMTDELAANIRQLVEITNRAERMQSELNVAREIQLSSLPKNFSFAEEKGVELYAYLIPAREIGGDLYDFFSIDDDHVCIAVGDVADKGVPAALFMVIVKKLISSKASEIGTLSPAEIMNHINEILCKDNQAATFVTLFIGILNVRNGYLRYANGGHVPPIFTNGDNAPFFKKELSGPVVGVFSGVKYKEIAAVVQQNGAMFICTDGITEAMNEEGHLFGEKRLLENFSIMQENSCNEVIEGILREVRMHAGQEPQSDDIAILMVRWSGKK